MKHLGCKMNDGYCSTRFTFKCPNHRTRFVRHYLNIYRSKVNDVIWCTNRSQSFPRRQLLGSVGDELFHSICSSILLTQSRSTSTLSLFVGSRGSCSYRPGQFLENTVCLSKMLSRGPPCISNHGTHTAIMRFPIFPDYWSSQGLTSVGLQFYKTWRCVRS